MTSYETHLAIRQEQHDDATLAENDDVEPAPAIERAQAVLDLAESRRRMGPHKYAPATAYSVLAAALDGPDLADEIGRHEKRVLSTGDGCWCGWEQPWPDRNDEHPWESHVADAVRVHLLGASS